MEAADRTTPTAVGPSQRWHDLDALRGFAMLLGIGLHAALSFYPSVWPVQDATASHEGLFDQVTPAVVLAYAHGIGLSGKPPSPVTIAARIACLSSCFRFLIRMGLVTSNPYDLVERPRTSGHAQEVGRYRGRRRLSADRAFGPSSSEPIGVVPCAEAHTPMAIGRIVDLLQVLSVEFEPALLSPDGDGSPP